MFLYTSRQQGAANLSKAEDRRASVSRSGGTSFGNKGPHQGPFSVPQRKRLCRCVTGLGFSLFKRNRGAVPPSVPPCSRFAFVLSPLGKTRSTSWVKRASTSAAQDLTEPEDFSACPVASEKPSRLDRCYAARQSRPTCRSVYSFPLRLLSDRRRQRHELRWRWRVSWRFLGTQRTLLQSLVA